MIHRREVAVRDNGVVVAVVECVSRDGLLYTGTLAEFDAVRRRQREDYLRGGSALFGRLPYLRRAPSRQHRRATQFQGRKVSK